MYLKLTFCFSAAVAFACFLVNAGWSNCSCKLSNRDMISDRNSSASTRISSASVSTSPVCVCIVLYMNIYVYVSINAFSVCCLLLETIQWMHTISCVTLYNNKQYNELCQVTYEWLLVATLLQLWSMRLLLLCARCMGRLLIVATHYQIREN